VSTERGLRDVDSALRVWRIKVAIYSVAAGVPIGAFAGVALALKGGVGSLGINVPIGAVLATVAIYRITWWVVDGSGLVVSQLHNPSGASTPAKRDYSFPKSLTARGRYEEAAVAYEAETAEHPEDPEPYLQLARLHRDKLGNFEEAAMWFKRARQAEEMDKGRDLFVTQELIELYSRKLRTPRRAIPELARLIDRHPDSPPAAAARQELAALRSEVAHDLDA
jgi:hypothetical protein